MGNAKKLLLEIAMELTGEKYKGLMLPITPLWNFQEGPKVSDGYAYSVNPLMFFVLALENLLLDEIGIDGEKIKISVEEGMREPSEQAKRWSEWQEKLKTNPTLPRDQFVNPNTKPSAHSTGSAIDNIFAGRHHTKDLIKVGLDTYGAYLPQDEQMRIKTTYFKTFGDASWDPQRRLNMHQSTHAVLTSRGKRDRNAVYAIANNKIQTAIDKALPFSTVTNDEVFHKQLRMFFSAKINEQQHDIKLDFPVMSKSDFDAQDFAAVEKTSSNIIHMATIVQNAPIYYHSHIIPGRRWDFWNEGSKGNNTPIGKKDAILREIESLVKWRDKTLNRSAGNQR